MFHTVVKNSVKGVALSSFSLEVANSICDVIEDSLPLDASARKKALCYTTGFVVSSIIVIATTDLVLEQVDSIF